MLEKYEKIAKLSFTEAERAEMERNIAETLGSWGRFGETDTSGAEPLVTVLDVRNILREDIRAKNFTRNELLENAPDVYEGYFLVPKTVQ